MKIENKTHYQTNDLKKLFTICMTQNEKLEGPYKRKKNLRITIGYSRYNYYSGNAYYGGPMKLRVPKNTRHYQRINGKWEKTEGLDVSELAWLFTHEFMHVRFYGHKQMAKNDMHFHAEEWQWANKYPIRIKEPKVKPKRDLRVERYKHAVEMVKKHEKQLKRTEGLLKKWRDKKAYYENDVEFLKKMIIE